MVFYTFLKIVIKAVEYLTKKESFFISLLAKSCKNCQTPDVSKHSF
jgi:hypothetical protein